MIGLKSEWTHMPYEMLVKETALKYDDAIFEHLKPYGITRENLFEQKDRLEIATCSFDKPKEEYFYVDGKLAFVAFMYAESLKGKYTMTIKIKDVKQKENNK